MKESDVKELEQLHAELAEYLTEIHSLNDEIAHIKCELQMAINQGNSVFCDED